MTPRFRSQWLKREPIRSWRLARSDALARSLRVNRFPFADGEGGDIAAHDDGLGCFRALARIVQVEMWLAVFIWLAWSLLQSLL